MKLYQKLIAYPLLAATLATGIAGCGRESTKQSNVGITASLEDSIETTKNPREIRNGLFEILLSTQGTSLNLNVESIKRMVNTDPFFRDYGINEKEKEIAERTENFVKGERERFGENYEDFLSDLVKNLSVMNYDEAKPLIQTAEKAVKQGAFGVLYIKNFREDLVGMTFYDAAKEVLDFPGYTETAQRNLRLGKAVAREMGLDTSYPAKIFVAAAYARVAENSKKINIFGGEGEVLDLGRQVAAEYGIDTKEYASMVVRTAIEEAYHNFREAPKSGKPEPLYLSVAQRQLNFAKEIARLHGIKPDLAKK